MESGKNHEEWYFQSDYDLETAKDMFKSGRMVYCIFMCHLSLEKALKGLLIKTKGEYPVKSHSLVFFIEKIGIVFSEDYYEFIYLLNRISVPTRYPDDLKKLFAEYTNPRTEAIMKKTEEIQ